MQPSIILGGKSKYRNDYPLLRRTATRGGSTSWACGKKTEKGNILLMYFQKPHSGIIAVSRAVTAAEPGKEWPYVAKIGKVKFIPQKISLVEIRSLFPRWRWHKYPRSHVYLDDRKANVLLKRADLPLETPPVSVKASGAGFGTPKQNRLVEKSARQALMKYFPRHKYKIRSREKENIGYDFDVRSANETLHVELKGVSGTDLSFVITANEVKCACKDQRFRLAVVTNARTAPRVWLFTAKEFLKRFTLKPLAYYANVR